jgi:hypothetical protein
MPEPEESFERLLGRQATDEERQRLHRVRDALGLRGNDALWLVLVALEHYRTLYERVPGEIATATQAAVSEVTAAATSAASAAAKTAAQEAKVALSRAAADAAATAARGATRKQLVQWCLATVLVVATLAGGAGWWGYRAGASASSDLAAGRAAWADSSEGRLAYALARAGSLKVLAKCEGPGWEVRGGKCYPQPLDGHTVYGWAIPPTAGNHSR